MDKYHAIADPIRRELIALLSDKEARVEGKSIKQLNAVAQVSRQAITKHLNVLIKHGIVSFEFRGKEKRHFLQPDALLEPAHWLNQISLSWDSQLHSLKHHLRGKSK